MHRLAVSTTLVLQVLYIASVAATLHCTLVLLLHNNIGGIDASRTFSTTCILRCANIKNSPAASLGRNSKLKFCDASVLHGDHQPLLLVSKANTSSSNDRSVAFEVVNKVNPSNPQRSDIVRQIMCSISSRKLMTMFRVLAETCFIDR
jgi:hypothetical protein